MSVLVEHGYSNATTVRIQAAAGVSRGRLLHHFPSRDSLLVASVHHLAAQRVQDLGHDQEWPDDPVARVALAVLIWSGHRSQADERSYQTQVLQAAVDWAGVLINMNKDNVDVSMQKLHDGTVGQLNADFDSAVEPYRQLVQTLQSRTTGQIDSVADGVTGVLVSEAEYLIGLDAPLASATKVRSTLLAGRRRHSRNPSWRSWPPAPTPCSSSPPP